MASSKILNFQDETVVTFNFKPTKHSLKNEEKSTMTSPLQTESVACETKQESMDVELQCNTLNDGRGQPEYDDPDLLMFLRKKKNLFEHAFLEHSTLTLSGNWFGSKNSATQTNLTGSLHVKFTADQDKEDFRINKIGLNIKGMVLAVAVGASKHLGSCEHTSFVCGWNLFRSNINPSEPHWTLNLNGCVVSMAWHPRKSSIFAAGTLNGVISIFDIGKEEGNPLLYQTQLNDFLHVDCISDLGWSIYKVNNNLKVLLVSSSVDGKILMWDMSDKMRYPKRGYLLERTTKGVNTKVSITAMGHKQHIRNHFIAASEGGSVSFLELEPTIADQTYKTILEKGLGPGRAKWDAEAICFMSNISKDLGGSTTFTKIKFEIEDYAKKHEQKTITIDVIMNSKPDLSLFYRNPIKEEFEPHHSIVRKLQVNPKQDDYFLTYALDNTLRVYRTSERDPLLVLNFDKSITHCGWVAINPNMIVVCLIDGSINFYDLSTSFEEPIERLRDSGKDEVLGRWVVDVDFYEDYEIMVVAYTNGAIDTYQINSAYKNSEFYLDKVYCN